MTLREEIEIELGVAKVGRRYHTAAALPPSAWRRTLKPWAALVLGWVSGMLFGVVMVLAWEMMK